VPPPLAVTTPVEQNRERATLPPQPVDVVRHGVADAVVAGALPLDRRVEVSDRDVVSRELVHAFEIGRGSVVDQAARFGHAPEPVLRVAVVLLLA